MLKRILVPTDGSSLSRECILHAAEFARRFEAAVIGVHVVPLPAEDELEAWAHRDPLYGQHHRALLENLGEEYLAFIANAMLAVTVPATVRLVEAAQPDEGVLAAAYDERCDLIYMASHGSGGGGRELPGSVALRVLAKSPVPVLLWKSTSPMTVPRESLRARIIKSPSG